jgi:hypothetical protein
VPLPALLLVRLVRCNGIAGATKGTHSDCKATTHLSRESCKKESNCNRSVTKLPSYCISDLAVRPIRVQSAERNDHHAFCSIQCHGFSLNSDRLAEECCQSLGPHLNSPLMHNSSVKQNLSCDRPTEAYNQPSGIPTFKAYKIAAGHGLCCGTERWYGYDTCS